MNPSSRPVTYLKSIAIFGFGLPRNGHARETTSDKIVSDADWLRFGFHAKPPELSRAE